MDETLSRALSTLRQKYQLNLNYTFTENNKCSVLPTLCKLISHSETYSDIRFPHRNFSLTHAHPYAIAMHCESCERFDGLGIDLEPLRPLTLQQGRYFLNSKEIDSMADLSKERLTQYWTIKEALFKADRTGQSKDFKDYEIDIKNLSARKKNSRFIFHSFAHQGWFFSLALRCTNIEFLS